MTQFARRGGEGGAQIQLKVMAYEPETYFSYGSALLKTTVSG